MIDDDKAPAGFSLRRWSARKRAAGAGVAPNTAAAPAATGVTATAPAAATGPVVPGSIGDGGDGRAAPAVLPPIETLTPSSDFTPFMQPEVDPALQRAALHKLFADPQFNVMDGLDVYIDDYSKPDPISPEMVRALHHARYIFSPPPTRMNDAGYVEDVPEDEREGAAGAPGSTAAVPPDPAVLAAPDTAAKTLLAAGVPASSPVAAGPAEAGVATSSPAPQADLPAARPPPPTR